MIGRKSVSYTLLVGALTLLLTACGGVQGMSSEVSGADNEESIILEVGDYTLEMDIPQGQGGQLDKRWFDVTSLAADAPNFFTGIKIPEGVSITVDGQKLVQDQTIEVTVEHMAKDVGIPVTVTTSASLGGLKETCYIRTLNYDVPELDFYVDADVEPGVYYTIFNNWLLKWDNQKEYIYFSNRINTMDFQRTEVEGKVYYSYMEYTTSLFRPNYSTTGGYNYSTIVVMDENYQIVDEIPYLSNDGDVEGFWPPEAHEHIILGEDHYLLLGYVPTYVNNIPEDIPHTPYGVRVLAAVIQEIKDGELVWEWWSTDHPEFYRMSIESNDWYNSIMQWNDYMHINSMTVDPKDGNIVCSARHLNAVFEIDKETQELNWVLGGKLDEFGLTEDQKFKRQHFARYTEDGTLTLFDNQTDWVSSAYPIDDSQADVGNGFPRVIEMRLDEENKTLLSYSAYDMQRHTGEFMGSTVKTGDETYLIGWGGSIQYTTPALFTEVDFASKKILCEAVATGKASLQTYRVYKYAE